MAFDGGSIHIPAVHPRADNMTIYQGTVLSRGFMSCVFLPISVALLSLMLLSITQH